MPRLIEQVRTDFTAACPADCGRDVTWTSVGRATEGGARMQSTSTPGPCECESSSPV